MGDIGEVVKLHAAVIFRCILHLVNLNYPIQSNL